MSVTVCGTTRLKCDHVGGCGTTRLKCDAALRFLFLKIFAVSTVSASLVCLPSSKYCYFEMFLIRKSAYYSQFSAITPHTYSEIVEKKGYFGSDVTLTGISIVHVNVWLYGDLVMRLPDYTATWLFGNLTIR